MQGLSLWFTTSIFELGVFGGRNNLLMDNLPVTGCSQIWLRAEVTKSWWSLISNLKWPVCLIGNLRSYSNQKKNCCRWYQLSLLVGNHIREGKNLSKAFQTEDSSYLFASLYTAPLLFSSFFFLCHCFDSELSMQSIKGGKIFRLKLNETTCPLTDFISGLQYIFLFICFI